MQKLNRDEIRALEKIAVQNRKNVLRLMRAGRMGHIGGALSCVDILTALYFNVVLCRDEFQSVYVAGIL